MILPMSECHPLSINDHNGVALLLCAIRQTSRSAFINMKLCCTQRHHIITCAKRGKSQNKTFCLLQKVHGDDSLSRTTCRHWYLQARIRDHSGVDLQRPRKQPSSRTLANVHAVGAVLDGDRHATVCQIAAEVQISTGSIHQILHEDLGMSKRAPKFVPWLLTADQKKQ